MFRTICLQLDVGCGADNFNSFEDQLIVLVRRGMIQMVGEYLHQLDEEMSLRFESEHREYRFNGRVSRVLKFYYGTIRISRCRYSCKGQQDVYPLDAFLPMGKMSAKIMEFGIDFSTEIPYARSSRLLEKILGVRVSGKGLWHLIQREGLKERALCEAERRRIFEEARDTYPQDWQAGRSPRLPVYLELDGTMVASREPGEERFEIKSGTMYRNIRQIGKSRKRLMDKLVYSATDSSERFSERFYAFCRKHGLPNWAQKTFISDGAGWLHNSAEYVFPEAEKRLDLYHLKRACSRILNEDEMNSLEQVIYPASSQEIIAAITDMLQSKSAEIQEGTDLLHYLYQNQDSLNYSPDHRNGSGAIEKNIGIHVGRRCKKQGMSWSHEGINNLLALRSKKLNELWQEISKKYA